MKTATKPKRRTWYIKNFDDYHEIKNTKTKKALEIGCFPPGDEDWGYCRYFALFYSGKRPSLKEVYDYLCKTGKIMFGYEFFGGYAMTKDTLKYELREHGLR